MFSGFKNTGLYPFNLKVIIKRFRVKKKERLLNNKSTKSALKTDDWRRINILIKEITNKKAIKKTQKLLIKIHDLTTQNILLRTQNKGLRSQLINERKRRKREKPLLIDFPADKHSKAIFYSPKKIQQTRDRMAEKEIEKKTTRATKKTIKTRRKAEKKEKAHILNKRRAINTYNKKIKEREKEQKRVIKKKEKTRKQTNQQLQKDIRKTKKSKRKIKHPIKINKADIYNILVDKVEVVPRLTNRREKKIIFSDKFRT